VTDEGALLDALREAAERLEARDAPGAAAALEAVEHACGVLGAQRLSPQALCDAHALHSRCESAARGLGAMLLAQQESAGQSRRALAAYRAVP
jgi:hypothetical protein